jgi:hypothetical protein
VSTSPTAIQVQLGGAFEAQLMYNSQLDIVTMDYEVHADLLYVTAWRGRNVLLSPVSRMFLSVSSLHLSTYSQNIPRI